MAARCAFRLLALALLAAGLAQGKLPCERPTVKSSVYTAADAHFSTHGIVSATFTVQCVGDNAGKGGATSQDIYAVFRGRAVQAAQDLDSSQYQVTFSEPDKTYLPAGAYTIDLYDDDGYAQYRKAQRGEASAAAGGSPLPKPVAQVEFDYPRVRRSLWVHSETVAVLALLGASFYAYSARKSILS